MVNLKQLVQRDSLFMRCFITAVAAGWVCILASDYPHPHMTSFRLGLHWSEAVCTLFLAAMAWVKPRRQKP